MVTCFKGVIVRETEEFLVKPTFDALIALRAEPELKVAIGRRRA